MFALYFPLCIFLEQILCGRYFKNGIVAFSLSANIGENCLYELFQSVYGLEFFNWLRNLPGLGTTLWCLPVGV